MQHDGFKSGYMISLQVSLAETKIADEEFSLFRLLVQDSLPYTHPSETYSQQTLSYQKCLVLCLLVKLE